MTGENEPSLTSLEPIDLGNGKFARAYRFGPLAVAGAVTYVTGDVIHGGTGASLGWRENGLFMSEAKQQFGSDVTPAQVQSWQVSICPEDVSLDAGRIPDSVTLQGLEEPGDKAAEAVIRRAIESYQQED
jgi:hypothetical protein